VGRDEGATEVSYALPADAGCVAGADGGTPGVPYVSALTSPTGELTVSWAPLPREDGGVECVVSGVSVGGVPAVRYGYALRGGQQRPGRLATVTWLDADGGALDEESFEYAPDTLTRRVAGTVVMTHRYTGRNVTAATGGSEHLEVTWGGATTSLSCGQTPEVRTVVDRAASRGDGTGAPASFSRRYEVLSRPPQGEAPRVYRVTEACGGSGSCSEGDVVSEWACATADVPGHEAARKDKRDAWEVYTTALAGDGGASALEVTRIQRGAVDRAGTSAEEETRYGYVYGRGGVQLLAWEAQASVLGGSGASARTAYRYDATTNVLTAELRTGVTHRFDGVGFKLVTRHVGTFHFRNQPCTNGPEDALGRILETHGPCEVSSPDAIDCDVATSAPMPVTLYSYYPPEAGRTLAGHLKELRQLTRGVPSGTTCASAPALVTRFNRYDEWGHLTELVDSTGVTTTLGYGGDKLTSWESSQGGVSLGTTRAGYENGALTWLQHPEGNFDVFSHRDGAGVWQEKVQWVARAADAAGRQWAEKLVFQWHEDGTLAAQTALAPPNEVRRVQRFNADAHRRPTYSESGRGAGAFATTRGYDRADNLAGLGHPFNSPPSWCAMGGDAPTSTLCSWLGYSRTNRLTRLTQFPTGRADDVGVSTCLTQDAQGHTSRVLTGAAGTDCAVDAGTASPPGDWATEYQHDDFGNVVSVTQPNTGQTSRGTVDSAFDAAGNLVFRQTQAQRAASPSEVEAFEYDALGRLLARRVLRQAGPGQVLARFFYDEADSPDACGETGPSNAAGRLRKYVDSFGQTWLQYDGRGRLLRETRVRGQRDATCAGKSPDDAPHTEYRYSLNGNLTSLKYPHGLQVLYGYGQGGLTDRVSSVSLLVLGASGVERRPVVASVTWEPFGGLAAWQLALQPASGAAPLIASVEYLLGDDATSAPSSGCAAPRPSSADSDASGRLRAIWVSSGPLGSGSGDIFKRTLTWKADALMAQDSCLLGAGSQRASFDYDALLRLKAAGSSPFAPFQRAWAFTSRGARLSETSEGASPSLFSFAAAHRPDAPTSISQGPFSTSFVWDSDGRLQRLHSPPDSSGRPSSSLSFSSPSPGLASTFSEVQLSEGAVFGSYRDAFSRRRLKQFPSGASEEFFYAQGHLMLEDRGVPSLSSMSSLPLPLDSYVWLDGRPLLVLRSSLDASSGAQLPLSPSSSCPRSQEPSPCGLFALIHDVSSAPLLVLDSNRLIAAAPSLRPFGDDSVLSFSSSPSPIPPSSSWTSTLSAGPLPPGTSVDVRADFSSIDNEACGPTAFDSTSLVDSSGARLSSVPSGHHLGRVLSAWVPLPRDGVVTASLVSDALSCRRSPTAAGGCSSCLQPSFPFSGLSLHSWRFRLRQAGASWFLPPLRFPGQFLDEESGLVDNWHRTYSPALGSYLSPEPLLQSPTYVRRMAQSGMSVPAYAYGANNPIRNTDPTGLFVNWDVRDGDVAAALLDIGLDPVLGPMMRRLWADPRNGVNLTRAPEGALEPRGGGYTSWPRRNWRGGNTCDASFDPEGHHRSVQSFGPTALAEDDVRALIAHELGHAYHSLYGGDPWSGSIDWENRLRSGPPRSYWRDPVNQVGLHGWPR
jgi:RHS repeat-associated protein